jgi:uncharacterized protein (DUF433 family)
MVDTPLARICKKTNGQLSFKTTRHLVAQQRNFGAAVVYCAIGRPPTILCRETTVSQEKAYVRVDEKGVYRVGSTRVMLDSVVAGFLQGHSPETIRQQYPALTLEEVYGSLAYYLGHAAEIDDYLRRQDALWEQWQARTEQQPSQVVERLRALRKAGVSEAT